ncbi:MAG: uroporphyrinogen decarboxylase/cobalamine-independent methonine synthase family protein [Thermoleophilia bacterium]
MDAERKKYQGEEQPLPRCASLAIGSLPHTDVEAAVELMIARNPVCPAWPQLPRLDFREGMYAQYAECMPAAIIDAERRRVWFDVERAPAEMAEFYERYFAGDAGLCAISADFAQGFHPFIERLPLPQARFLKGQVTGPASFGLTVTDAANKPVLYHPDLFETVVKALALKGGWQVRQFLDAAPGAKPVIFFDEPYLTQVGSAVISLPAEQIVASLNECFAPVHELGGYTGTHVCGGTDWGLLASTEVDILHFDAADHQQELFCYEVELAGFLERGGMLAWGMIPTDERSLRMSGAAVAEQVIRSAEKVAAFAPSGIDELEVLQRSFVSQSCGLGSREAGIAERCLELAAEVSDALDRQIC